MEKKVKLHISAQTGRSFRTTVQGQRISSVGHVAQLIPAISSLLMTNSTWRLMSRMPSIFSSHSSAILSCFPHIHRRDVENWAADICLHQVQTRL